ncbi:MAG: four helix bundle protein [Rhodocyclaceae bacterium]|nr:four helix bundle protein [Rhodocyclaceae bacterium]
MARFEELEVWKRSARLSADIYKSLTDLRDFGFKDQITRAGLSIRRILQRGMRESPETKRPSSSATPKVRLGNSGRRSTLASTLDTSNEKQEKRG